MAAENSDKKVEVVEDEEKEDKPLTIFKEDKDKDPPRGEDGEVLATVVKPVRISRTERPEFEIDLEEIEDFEVFNENGYKFKFGSLYKNKKTIFVFIRHFLCFTGKEYVEDLALVPDKIFKDANIQLIVVGCGNHLGIAEFRKDTGYRGIMVVDPERELYKKIGMKSTRDMGAGPKDSRHIKSGFFGGMWYSTTKIMSAQEYRGDVNQQGGTLIIGPGSQVHFTHLDTNSSSHMQINDILVELGLQKVSFPRDPQVLHI